MTTTVAKKVTDRGFVTTLIRANATPAERRAGKPYWFGSRILRVPAPGDPRDRRVA